MENSKLSSLMIFAFCSTINENLDSIYYIYTMYNGKIKNIKNNERVITLNKDIKEVMKDLFK